MVSKSIFSLVLLVTLLLVTGGNQMMAAAEPIGEQTESSISMNLENQHKQSDLPSPDIKKIALQWNIDGLIDSAVFSPDRKWAAIRSVGGVYLYNVNTGNLVGFKASTEDLSTATAFSPDSKRFAIGTCNGNVILWNIETMESLIEDKFHDGIVSSIAFSHDGNHMVTASGDGTSCIINAQNGEFKVINVAEHLHHDYVDKISETFSLASFSPDDKHVITVSNNAAVVVWNTFSQKIEYVVADPFFSLFMMGRRIDFAGFCSDNNSVFTLTSEKMEIHHLGIHENYRVSEVDQGMLPNSPAVLSNDRKYFAISKHSNIGCDQYVEVWDIKSGDLLYKIDQAGYGWRSICFSPHGNRLLVGSDDDGLVQIFNSHNGELLHSSESKIYYPVFSKHGGDVIGLSYDENGKPIFVKWRIGHNLNKPLNS